MAYTTAVIKGDKSKQFDDAKQIRISVFVKEQGFVNEFDETDSSAYHFIIYDNCKPVGVGRYYGKENPYHIGRIAVAAEYRGKGLGLFIMNEIESFAKKNGAESLILSAQTRAEKFYQKCGFKRTGDEYSDEFCPHIDMIKFLD